MKLYIWTGDSLLFCNSLQARKKKPFSGFDYLIYAWVVVIGIYWELLSFMSQILSEEMVQWVAHEKTRLDLTNFLALV